jgi:hypothetical protein
VGKFHIQIEDARTQQLAREPLELESITLKLEPHSSQKKA